MGAVDSIGFGAEDDIVPRCAPRGLFGDLGILHSIFVEKAFFLGDDQRRRIRQSNIAEDDLADLRAARRGENARGKSAPGGRGHQASTRAEEPAAGQTSLDRRTDFFAADRRWVAHETLRGKNEKTPRFVTPFRACESAALLSAGSTVGHGLS